MIQVHRTIADWQARRRQPGLNPEFRTRLARPSLDGAGRVLEAMGEYDRAVKAGTFPAAEESYS
jgi:hypothetical protein